MPIADQFRLTGRTALVTGGSKGIGLAIAQAFAEAGADVAISSRTRDQLEAAADAIRRAAPSSRVEFFVADMKERDQQDRLAATVLERFGKVDIVVNNAGSNMPQPLDQTTDAVWDEILELNLTSGMRLCRAVVAGMKERRWGRIIHTSSIMGLASNPGRGAYSATKAGLIGMLRAHALELGPYNITVNAIAPGPIATDLPMSLLSPAEKEAFAARPALKRWGDPAELAGPALLLASEAGSYITGETIVVDGGTLCRTFW